MYYKYFRNIIKYVFFFFINTQYKTIFCKCINIGMYSFQNLTKDMADYCVARMKPFVDVKTERPITGALDYIEFTKTLFQN